MKPVMKRAASRRSRSRGFSLIELMIALVAGLIVSYAVVAFTMSSMKSNAEYVQSTRLTQSLRNALDVVVRDLRRAGYDDKSLARLAGGSTNSLVGQSPFSKVYLTSVASQGDCIIYAYDRPGGTAGALNQGNQEIRGLRKRIVTPSNTGRQVGVVEYAVSTTTGKPTCADASATYTTFPASCNGVWCPLTDASTVNIDTFTIAETSSTVLGADPIAVRIRNLQIDLNGRLVGDDGTSYLNGVSTSFRRGLRATIKVRSDCVNTTISTCNNAY
jgi:prepilin-type N-terminal cleavage/methylation domain-containing protein